ncbi:MAG: anti-sigma regulatory factor [Azospirillaceae bacterium]|nr:anti-sigma regulatory factor [Azospirillaceae bacterium]
MTEETKFAFSIHQEYDVYHAQQRALDFARDTGFRRAEIYRLATVVTELCNNLVFHTQRGGLFTMRLQHRSGRWGIELTVEDDGPGILDLDLAMSDGFSTVHGLGSGLPGSRRLMDEFHIESKPGVGTKVIAWLRQ